MISSIEFIPKAGLPAVVSGPRIKNSVGIKTEEPIEVAADSTNSIVTLAAPNYPTRASWYADYIERKKRDMWVGGTYANYSFKDGLAKTYFGAGEASTYVKSIQNTLPDIDGNISILPTEETDVWCDQDKIFVKRLPEYNSCSYYEMIDKMLWRLYHAVCWLKYRLCAFNPTYTNSTDEGLALGTIPNYVATVARWNHYVWASQATGGSSTANGTLAITMAYSSTQCTSGAVRMHLEITNEDVAPAGEEEEGKDYDTYAKYLTLYRQSDVNNLSNGVTPTVVLKKLGVGVDVVLSGDGVMEELYAWNKMTADITFSGCGLFDKYQILLSVDQISVSKTAIEAQYYRIKMPELAPSNKTSTYKIKYEWYENNVLCYTKTETKQVARLTEIQQLPYQEEEEESE